MAKNPIRAAKQRPLDVWYETIGEEWLKHHDPSDPPEVEALLRIRAFAKGVDKDKPEQVSASLKAIARVMMENPAVVRLTQTIH